MFSLGPARQGRYCPAALCSGRPAIRPVAEKEKRRPADCGTQFKAAACRKTIEALPGAETAHHSAESARCDRLLQRPEQILFTRSGDQQHPVWLDPERGKPVPVKFAALLRLAARAAEAEAFSVAGSARRKGQGKSERYSLIARRHAVQFMKARDKQSPRVVLRDPRDHILLGGVRADVKNLVRRHDRFVLFLFLQRERHFR